MTNTKKSDLLELAERVEAGADVDAVNAEIMMLTMGVECVVRGDRIGGKMWMYKSGTPEGPCPDAENPVWRVTTSLDAAKALHDAVLPGWKWAISNCTNVDDDLAEVEVWPNPFTGSFNSVGKTTNPSAAWVAAILRAKAGVE